MTLILALAVGILYSCGTYLILQRKLTRIVLGLAILAHGANLLLLLAGGRAGVAPFIGQGQPENFADPLPQALALTAVVITFGTTALLLALSFRSWKLRHDDDVEDDLEDRRLAREAARHKEWHRSDEHARAKEVEQELEGRRRAAQASRESQ